MGKQNKSEPKRKNRGKNKTGKCENVPLESGNTEIPYRIQESEVLGRYLVASRNLRAGEVVVSDEPIVVGPCQEAEPLCIGCYVDIDLSNSKTYQRCENCSWPMCSSKCPGRHEKNGHTQEECNLLTKSKINKKDITSFKDFYYGLTPFRCLILKENPEKWKILSSMESHKEKRKKSTELWTLNEKMAVDVIRNVWELKEFSEEEIHFVCGVLEVNAFEVSSKSPGTQSIRAIYPKAFLFSHDCVPNTRRSNGKDFELIVRCMSDIQKNEMITISYAYTLQSTLMRRRHLEKTKFFSCICKRCSDPTEFNTHTGAIKCLVCNVGHLLPENPLDENSNWVCSSHKCSNQMNSSRIVQILDDHFKELDSIDGNDIEGYEAFVKKCSSLYHENHYLSLSAMHCLSQLYGKIHGFLINDLTDEQLERKEQICRKLIRIFEKFEPGLSKQKGILLYELQAPLMVLLRRKCHALTKKELRSKVKEVLKYLNEAYTILSMEPECSDELQMGTAAREAMSSLQDWLNLLN